MIVQQLGLQSSGQLGIFCWLIDGIGDPTSVDHELDHSRERSHVIATTLHVNRRQVGGLRQRNLDRSLRS